MSKGDRNPEIKFDRQRHDRGFQCEQGKGERGIDERSDCRAEIAETGRASQQIDIDVMACSVIADRKTGDENDDADRDDGPESIGETVIDGQETADGFQHQKRGGTECRVGDLEFRPFTE